MQVSQKLNPYFDIASKVCFHLMGQEGWLIRTKLTPCNIMLNVFFRHVSAITSVIASWIAALRHRGTCREKR